MTIRRGGAPANIAAGLRNFARVSPRAVAIRDEGRDWSFAELDERARRIAQHLRGGGLQPGDRVAVLMGNRSEYLEAAAAISRAGMVMVPVNPRLAPREQVWIVEHAECRALVGDASAADLDPSAFDVVLALDDVGLGPDYETSLAGADAADVWDPGPETDTFAIVYTSGTTGQPKGVCISHRSRTLNFYCAAIDWRLGPGRRTMAVAPLYHGAGFSFAMGGIYTGSTVTMLRSWDPERFLSLVDRDEVQSVFLVPTHAQMLRDVEDSGPVGTGESLDTLFFNAAALPTPLKAWVTARFPTAGIHELYGSTEAGVVSNLRPEDNTRKPGSVGPPWFLTEVRLRTEDGGWLDGPGTGELFSRSPFLMNGYHEDPEATQACTTEDGFLTSGDVVTIDEDGYLHVVDRVKDVIISGGANIYPKEVEVVLREDPDVRDVAVVGTDDERWGETVTAVVVPTPAASEDHDGLRARLEARSRDELAGYKVPRRWTFVNELPRNATNKVLKRELRRELADRFRNGEHHAP